MAKKRIKPKSTRQKRASRHERTDRNQQNKNSRRSHLSPSARRQEQKLRCINALHLFRSGKAKSASDAAHKAGTTIRTMKKIVPRAIDQNRPGGRIHIKSSDPYSAAVEILTESGAVVAIARGSRQRELAGRHRATWLRVLRGKEPPSALDQYRGKKVGGYELLSDYDQLRLFARAGVLGQLDTLYVSPDVSV